MSDRTGHAQFAHPVERDLARLADRWSLDELAAANGPSGVGQV